jgi:hypothetical protein
MRIVFKKELCGLKSSCAVRTVKSRRLQSHGFDGQHKKIYKILPEKPIESWP